MGRATSSARRALAVLGLGIAVAACLSPTLPLPPPAIPSFSTQGVPPGEVELESVGGAEPNAIIVIYNQNPSVPLDKRVSGAQADAKGSWDAVVTGATGDALEITQQSGTLVSPSTTVQIPAL